jgi:hypothetical protein
MRGGLSTTASKKAKEKKKIEKETLGSIGTLSALAARFALWKSPYCTEAKLSA